MRRVMEQPPLKLDTSSEVLEHKLYTYTLFTSLFILMCDIKNNHQVEFPNQGQLWLCY